MPRGVCGGWLSRLSAEEGLGWGPAGVGCPSPRGWVSLAHVPLGPQDYCGQNTSLGSFSIITENVPCGTTGVTCSKAIKIFIGVSAAPPRGVHGPWGPLGPGQ